MGPLVTTEELARHPAWRVFDCRHDLMKPLWGEEAFRAGHLPGARFARSDEDLAAPKNGRNGRHPLPAPEVFLAWLGREGVRPSDPVVCYDQGPGVMASRLWWMLRWVGHASVAVLDGGMAKWTAEGRPVVKEVSVFPPTTYAGRVQPWSVAVDEVVKHREAMVLVDARAPARFRGEQEPIDPVAGHIPGARNRFSNDNVNADGTFKSAALLRQEFDALLQGRPAGDVVHYCGSGVSACHNLLAMDVAGLSGARLYAGSWSEWIADPARPRAP